MTLQRRRRLWVGCGLLGLLAAGLCFVRGYPAPVPEVPGLPAGTTDDEARDAVEEARQAVLEAPASAAGWGRLGMILLAHLLDQEADRCFAKAARLDPTESKWPYARGIIALKRDPGRAVEYLRRAATGEPTPERAVYHLQLADAVLERGDLDRADTIFSSVRATEGAGGPAAARAALGLGMIAAARKQYAAAKSLLVEASRSPFARKQAFSHLALIAGTEDGPKDAAGWQRRAADLPPDPPWPDPILDVVIGLQTGRRGRQRRIAELEREHRFREAADEYLRDATARPTAEAYTGAGINLARLGDYDRALPLLREAVRLEPDNPQAVYTLALTMFTRAEKEWHRTPDSPEARDWFAESITLARRTVALKPDNARAYLFWGEALRHLGRPAEAIEPLRTGVACRPEVFDLQLALGEALADAGRLDEAKNHLENARSLDPADPRPGAVLSRLRTTSRRW